MKEKSFLGKILHAVWPIFIYMIVQNLVAIVGMIVILRGLVYDSQGNMEVLTNDLMEISERYGVLFILIAALICIPIYHRMCQKDCREAGETGKNIPITNKDILAIILSGAALAMALNNIISITPLPVLFPGYEEVNETLQGGGILLEILCAGIFACIVEELIMRGVVYSRMKRYWGPKNAMIFSALVFGIYHLNVLQAVYAFLMGLFLAWLYERYDSLWAPIIAHMSANLFVTLMAESTFFCSILNTLIGFCLITCVSLLTFYYGWRWIKQTNPLVELEFVEKEPDTLKGLTEEYKEQEEGEDDL